MHALILTLFPDMFPGPLGHSLAGKALERGLWSLETLNIRDFATDKHKTVDDKSYGGGTGLVLKPDVVGAAIDAAQAQLPGARLIYLTPRGTRFTQDMAYQLISSPARGGDPVHTPPACGGDGGEAVSAKASPPVNGGGKECPGIIILCGRYEGVDQRVIDVYQPLEISLGDYVLSGGELVAMVLLDACIRLIPGVISKEEALEFESFSCHPGEGRDPRHAAPSHSMDPGLRRDDDFIGLLEYPHYTSPPSWRGHEVPDILRSGNHQKVAAWRLAQAEAITKARRPDLWERYESKTKD